MAQEIDELSSEYRKRLERELGVKQAKKQQPKQQPGQMARQQPQIPRPQYTPVLEAIPKRTGESNYYTAVIGLSLFYLFAYLPIVLLFIFAGNISFFTSSFFFILILVVGFVYGLFASKQIGKRTPSKLLASGFVIPLPTAVLGVYIFLNAVSKVSQYFSEVVGQQFKGALDVLSLPSPANIPIPLTAAIGYYLCFIAPFVITFFMKKKE